MLLPAQQHPPVYATCTDTHLEGPHCTRPRVWLSMEQQGGELMALQVLAAVGVMVRLCGNVSAPEGSSVESKGTRQANVFVGNSRSVQPGWRWSRLANSYVLCVPSCAAARPLFVGSCWAYRCFGCGSFNPPLQGRSGVCSSLFVVYTQSLHLHKPPHTSKRCPQADRTRMAVAQHSILPMSTRGPPPQLHATQLNPSRLLVLAA